MFSSSLGKYELSVACTDWIFTVVIHFILLEQREIRHLDSKKQALEL